MSNGRGTCVVTLCGTLLLLACGAPSSSNGSAAGGSEPREVDAKRVSWQLAIHTGSPSGLGYRDGALADARFAGVASIAELDGALYLVDAGNRAIRKVDIASGQTSTIAGDARNSLAGACDGVGSDARFAQPGHAALLGRVLYVADDALVPTLRAVALDTGVVSTVIDTAMANAYALSGRIAVAALAGRLYLASNFAIYAFDPNARVLQLVAGKAGERGSVDGTALEARFEATVNLAHAGANQLLVGGLGRVRRVDLTDGRVVTLAGSPAGSPTLVGHADGVAERGQFGFVPAISGNAERAYLADWAGWELTSDGNLVFAPFFAQIRELDLHTGRVEHLSGRLPLASGWIGERDGAASDTTFLYPRSLLYVSGTLYVGERSALRRVDTGNGAVSTIAGALTDGPLGDMSGLTLLDGEPHVFLGQRQALGRSSPTEPKIQTLMGYNERRFPVGFCQGLAALDDRIYCATSIGWTTTLASLTARGSDVALTSISDAVQPIDLVVHGRELLLLEQDVTSTDYVVRLRRLYPDENMRHEVLDQLPVRSTAPRLAVLGERLFVTDATRLLRYDLTKMQTVMLSGSEEEAGCRDGIAQSARFTGLQGIAADTAGLFVGDVHCHQISYINADTGRSTILVGDPERSAFVAGDRSEAGVNWPDWMSFDRGSGKLFIVDTRDNVIGALSKD